MRRTLADALARPSLLFATALLLTPSLTNAESGGAPEFAPGQSSERHAAVVTRVAPPGLPRAGAVAGRGTRFASARLRMPRAPRPPKPRAGSEIGRSAVTRAREILLQQDFALVYWQRAALRAARAAPSSVSNSPTEVPDERAPVLRFIGAALRRSCSRSSSARRTARGPTSAGRARPPAVDTPPATAEAGDVRRSGSRRERLIALGLPRVRRRGSLGSRFTSSAPVAPVVVPRGESRVYTFTVSGDAAEGAVLVQFLANGAPVTKSFDFSPANREKHARAATLRSVPDGTYPEEPPHAPARVVAEPAPRGPTRVEARRPRRDGRRRATSPQAQQGTIVRVRGAFKYQRDDGVVVGADG